MTKTRELQTLWWDWLSTSERVLSTLKEQTTALVRRDVSSIERLQPELDTMLNRMKEIDDRAAASAIQLAGELGTEPNLRGLTEALPAAEAQQVQGLANRVKAVARNLQEALDRNRRLLDSELIYVNGTLALIAKSARENQGRFGSQVPSTVLVDHVA